MSPSRTSQTKIINSLQPSKIVAHLTSKDGRNAHGLSGAIPALRHGSADLIRTPQVFYLIHDTAVNGKSHSDDLFEYSVSIHIFDPALLQPAGEAWFNALHQTPGTPGITDIQKPSGFTVMTLYGRGMTRPFSLYSLVDILLTHKQCPRRLFQYHSA